jgi:hypothetical protein
VGAGLGHGVIGGDVGSVHRALEGGPVPNLNCPRQGTAVPQHPEVRARLQGRRDAEGQPVRPPYSPTAPGVCQWHLSPRAFHATLRMPWPKRPRWAGLPGRGRGGKCSEWTRWPLGQEEWRWHHSGAPETHPPPQPKAQSPQPGAEVPGARVRLLSVPQLRWQHRRLHCPRPHVSGRVRVGAPQRPRKGGDSQPPGAICPIRPETLCLVGAPGGLASVPPCRPGK